MDICRQRESSNKNFLHYYQPKSGTALAFDYAAVMKRRIINLSD